MGIYAGPAPWPELQALWNGQQHGEWGIDFHAWHRLNDPYIRPAGIPATLYGLPVRVDETLPPGTIELRNSQGETLGRMTGLAYENTNKQTPRPPIEAQQPPRRIAALRDKPPPVFTGPTTRLVGTCRACGDTLPDGAKFCISCGEAAHAPA